MNSPQENAPNALMHLPAGFHVDIAMGQQILTIGVLYLTKSSTCIHRNTTNNPLCPNFMQICANFFIPSLFLVLLCGDVHLPEDPLELVRDGGLVGVAAAGGEGRPARVAAVRVRVLDQGAPVLVLGVGFLFSSFFD